MDSDPVELLESTADERLLEDGNALVPTDIGPPPPAPAPSRARRRIVGTGAALTGTSFAVGGLLLVAGAVVALADGFPLVAIAMLALGLLLVGTHWGWVHIAEITAQALEARRDRASLELRRHWLTTIKPYTRYEVSTRVADDGSIAIVRTRVRPVRSGASTFTFAREVELEELHSGDEPAAVVTERAELLRRQAVLDTERERECFQVAADAYETELLGRDDERERLVARRAAAAALSERINANLRDPPLIE